MTDSVDFDIDYDPETQFQESWEELGSLINRLPDDILDKERVFLSFVENNGAGLGCSDISPVSYPDAKDVFERLVDFYGPEELVWITRTQVQVFRLHPDIVGIESFWEGGRDCVLQFPSEHLPLISFNGQYWRIDHSKWNSQGADVVGDLATSTWLVPDDSSSNGVVRYWPASAIESNPWIIRSALRRLSGNGESAPTFEVLAEQLASKIVPLAPNVAESLLRPSEALKALEAYNFEFTHFDGNCLCRPVEFGLVTEGDPEDFWHNAYPNDERGTMWLHRGRNGVAVFWPIADPYCDCQSRPCECTPLLHGHQCFDIIRNIQNGTELVEAIDGLSSWVNNHYEGSYYETPHALDWPKILRIISVWVPEMHADALKTVNERRLKID